MAEFIWMSFMIRRRFRIFQSVCCSPEREREREKALDCELDPRKMAKLDDLSYSTHRIDSYVA